MLSKTVKSASIFLLKCAAFACAKTHVKKGATRAAAILWQLNLDLSIYWIGSKNRRLAFMTIKELTGSDPAFLSELARLLQGEHWDPHHFLGLHPYFENKQVIRIYRPGATEVFLQVAEKTVPARRIHEAGVFDYIVS